MASLYQGLLGQIDNNIQSRDQVATSFFTSPEFTTGGFYVIKLPESMLKRDPDFTGWHYWFNSLAQVPSLTVLNSFLTSLSAASPTPWA